MIVGGVPHKTPPPQTLHIKRLLEWFKPWLSPNDLEKVSARKIHRAAELQAVTLISNPNRIRWGEGLDKGGLAREAYEEYLEGREQKVPVCLPRLLNWMLLPDRTVLTGHYVPWFRQCCLESTRTSATKTFLPHIFYWSSRFLLLTLKFGLSRKLSVPPQTDMSARACGTCL